MDRVRYMISDAAGLVNVESHVLRYWEEELELDIPRNELGHRYYTQENIRELTGMPDAKTQMDVSDIKKQQVYFKNPEMLTLAESRQNVLDNTDRMTQFRELMSDIVGKAIAENNEELGRVISGEVGEQVVKEMNYLMREREELEEERFAQLNEVIRGSLKDRKKKEPFLKRWGKKSAPQTKKKNP